MVIMKDNISTESRVRVTLDQIESRTGISETRQMLTPGIGWQLERMGLVRAAQGIPAHSGRDGATIRVNKSPKCSTWTQSQKRQNDCCSSPRQTISVTVIQVYAPTSNTEEAESEWFYEDLQDLL